MRQIDPSERRSYAKIAEHLIERIKSEDLPDGTFLPIEKDLMSEYGVTRTTVRRALAVVVEEGYGTLIPNKGVLPIKAEAPRSKSIAFVDGSSLVLRSLYSKLNAEFLTLGYHLVHIDSEVIGLEHALLFAEERGYDAAFIWSFEGFPDTEVVHRVAKKMPIIALDHALRGFEADLVTYDFFQMAVEAVDYLLKASRKRVAVTGMLDMLETTHDRFSGYLKALFDNGLTPSVTNFAFSYTSGYGPVNYEHLIHRLRADDRPDALFVMQDEFVPSAVDAVLQCGLSIPGDVEIATIGDDVVVSVGGQGITSVHCDWDAFAELALNLMLDRLRDPSGPKRRLVGPHSLSRGRSQKAIDLHQSQTFVVTRQRKRGHIQTR